jgi:hypothetical protein
MNTLLTNAIIEEAFAKTGVDRKYFPQYEAEAKRRYELFRKDFPEDEDPTYEDNNANKSIILTNDYIAFYVHEAEKGHCHKWSDSVARARVSGEHEFNVYYDAYSSIENDVERERELRIRAKSLFPDSFAQDRYIFLFKEQVEYPQKETEEYIKCISRGKN